MNTGKIIPFNAKPGATGSPDAPHIDFDQHYHLPLDPEQRSAFGMFLIMAQLAYDDTLRMPPNVRASAAGSVGMMLTAAAGGRCEEIAELRSLLVKGRITTRVKQLARRAVHHVPASAFATIYQDALVNGLKHVLVRR